MLVSHSERENMIGTFFIESPMNQVSNRNMDCSDEISTNFEEKHMKVKKTRRGKPRKWCMNDLLDQRPNLALSPPGSPSSSPQAKDTSITLRYRYEQQASPVGKVHSRKQNRSKSLRPYSDPGAPHNTTEFLIEDKIENNHSFSLFNYDQHLKDTYNSNHFRLAVSSAFEAASSEFEAGFRAYASDGENCLTSSSDEQSSDSSSDDLSASCSYDVAQFEEAYEDAKEAEKAGRKQNLSHSELVCSVKALQRRMAFLERRERCKPKRSSLDASSSGESMGVSSLQDELSKLVEINRQLQQENDVLKDQTASS